MQDYIVKPHEWEKFFPTPPRVYNPLDQGVFEKLYPKEDRFGYCQVMTTATDDYVPNRGMGYQPYIFEENGLPNVPGETVEQAVENLVRLPFGDNIYCRLDWRDVQKKPGELDLPEMWKFAFKLAKDLGKRVSFRIQLANPNIYPKCSVPDFVLKKSNGTMDLAEWVKIPYFDHPELQAAFRDLNKMLCDLYDEDPMVEYVDLAGYGAWGEWHTYVKGTQTGHITFPDSLTASRTLCDMVAHQIDTWKCTPLVMNAHGGCFDIRLKDVVAFALREGCWLRRDNVGRFIRPSDAYMITNRPPWVAGLIEDGRFREHIVDDPEAEVDDHGQHIREQFMMRVLDLNSNYWSLWQHATNILKYREKYPRGFEMLDRHMGYKVRPAWIWIDEKKQPQNMIIGIKNDGAAPVPGILRIYVSDEKATFKIGGGLVPGTPHQFSHTQAMITLPKNVDWKGLRLSAAIEIKSIEYPVTWACREKLNADGSLTLKQTKGLMLGTRKRPDGSYLHP